MGQPRVSIVVRSSAAHFLLRVGLFAIEYVALGLALFGSVLWTVVGGP